MPPKNKRENSPMSPAHPTKKTKVGTNPEAASSMGGKGAGKSNEKDESHPQTVFAYLLTKPIFY